MNFQPPDQPEDTRTDYEIGLDEGRAEQSTRITELEVQLSAAQKDAAWYQWLRDNAFFTSSHDGYVLGFPSLIANEHKHVFGDEFNKDVDVAIDAAIAGEAT